MENAAVRQVHPSPLLGTPVQTELSTPLLPAAAYTLPIHPRNAGLNPLTDAGAHLFSLAGTLRQLKCCLHPDKLHRDLMTAVNTFQEAVRQLGYGPDHVLASRYAICVTLDDLIGQSAFGAGGQWQPCALPESVAAESGARPQEKFFMILDKITREPARYIDLMEFMYICLSLGFRGHYHSTDFAHQQLDQLTDRLYHLIRSHRGETGQTLSPFPVRAAPAEGHISRTQIRSSRLLLLAALLVPTLFLGLSGMLSILSGQLYAKLAHIGAFVSHENISSHPP